jgi:hypothetical protein
VHTSFRWASFIEGDHLHNLGVGRNIIFYSIISLTFFPRAPFGFEKQPWTHILARINTEYSDEGPPKLYIYISELRLALFGEDFTLSRIAVHSQHFGTNCQFNLEGNA